MMDSNSHQVDCRVCGWVILGKFGYEIPPPHGPMSVERTLFGKDPNHPTGKNPSNVMGSQKHLFP